MNFSDIKNFLEIVRSGSINKAAENLYISQPALSQQLKALEKELGADLIVRSRGSRVLKLTPNGERFFEYAIGLEHLMLESKSLFKAREDYELTVIGVESFNLYIFPQIYPIISEQLKNLKLKLLTYKTYFLYQKIINNEADVGFVNRILNTKSVDIIPVFHEKMYFICDANAPYPENNIDMKTLDPANEVFFSWSSEYLEWHDRYFSSFVKPHIYTDKFFFIEDFIVGSNLWAIVPASFLSSCRNLSLLRTAQLQDPIPDRTCYMLCRKKEGVGSNPAFNVLKHVLFDYVKNNSWLDEP